MSPPKSVGQHSIFVRLWRMARLIVHLLRGLVTTWLLFPRASALARANRVQAWSHQLISIAGVRIERVGELPAHDRMVFVANHISWVDIFSINAQRAVSFVAKAELAQWPLAGRLLKNVGTLFINRSSRRDTGRVGRLLSERLSRGEVLAFFPEGRVSHGTDVHAFHGSLLQPAIDADSIIVPIAIQYAPLAAFDYVNRTFLQSVWSVVGAKNAVVTLTFLPAEMGADRRELAKRLERAIRNQIKPAAVATDSEK
jgi:1-acyl-sn-glycerol-3-phosphate acyltransferase